MKPLILTASALIFMLSICSCSTDNSELEISHEEFSTSVDSGKFDETFNGLYKGVFTTLEGTERGTIEVYAYQPPFTPEANLTMADGSNFKVSGERISSTELKFDDPAISFNFKASGKGGSPIAENVFFNKKQSNILLQKQTSKASLTVVTGYYYCIECGFHPDLNAITAQSLNFIFSNDGEGTDETMSTQLVLNGTLYSNTIRGNGASQISCVTSGDFTTCDIASGGPSGSIAFYGGSGPVYITGEHIYSNTSEACSTVTGQFQYTSTIFGTVILGFESDGPKECEVTKFESLIYENFEDDDETYQLVKSANDQLISESFGSITDRDYGYYGKFIKRNPANVYYEYKLGYGYFAAQNTNKAPDGQVDISLLFDNEGLDYDITGKSEISISGYFGTFTDSSIGGWTKNSSVEVEYSFDKGNTWEKALVLAAGPNATNKEEDKVYLDINGDGVGDTDQTQIKTQFTRLQKTIENSSGSTSFRARIAIKKLDKLNRDIAIDNFMVEVK